MASGTAGVFCCLFVGVGVNAITSSLGLLADVVWSVVGVINFGDAFWSGVLVADAVFPAAAMGVLTLALMGAIEHPAKVAAKTINAQTTPLFNSMYNDEEVLA